MPRRLATRTSAPVTSRTWVTPPGEPSASAVPMDCTESSTISDGCTSSMWPEHRAEVGLGGQDRAGRRARRSGRPAAGPGPRTPHRTRRAWSGPPWPSARRPRAAGSTCPTPGLTGQQHDRTGHQPVAEHPVQLAHAGQRPGGQVGAHLADRHRLAHRHRGRHLGQLGRSGLDHAAPGLALTAPPDPAARGPAALGALVAWVGWSSLAMAADARSGIPTILRTARGGRAGQRGVGGDFEHPGVRLGLADGDPDPVAGLARRRTAGPSAPPVRRPSRTRRSAARPAARRSCPGRPAPRSRAPAARPPARPGPRPGPRPVPAGPARRPARRPPRPGRAPRPRRAATPPGRPPPAPASATQYPTRNPASPYALEKVRSTDHVRPVGQQLQPAYRVADR